MIEVKKRLLYIGSSGLGENIMHTPSMDFLSSIFDVDLIVKDKYCIFFENYNFIKRVIPSSSATGMVESYDFQTSHFDKCLSDYHFNIPILQKNQKYIKLSATEIKLYMFGCDVDSYNCKYRCPTSINRDGVRRIVVYIGSKENIRRIPIGVYNTLIEKIYEKYSATHQVIALYDSSACKVVELGEHIVCDVQSEMVIKLFESGVEAMIGPDSGLTHVALAYDIPQIFIEGRDRIEMVFPKILFNLIDIYKKLDSRCDRDCKSFSHINIYGNYAPRHQQFFIKNFLEFNNLSCRHISNSPCLSFHKKDIDNIMCMLDARLRKTTL